MGELEKIIADLKAQRDLLMKHLDQINKEKESIVKKFGDLKEEVERMLIKMRDEYERYSLAIDTLNRQLSAKDDELANKDAVIKNLT